MVDAAPVDLSESDVKMGVSETGPCSHAPGQRCSDKGFLPMATVNYLNLLDWTTRQVRSDKQGATPQHLDPIFDRLGVSSEVWCHLVKHFGKLFSIVAGRPNQIDGLQSRETFRLQPTTRIWKTARATFRRQTICPFCPRRMSLQ